MWPTIILNFASVACRFLKVRNHWSVFSFTVVALFTHAVIVQYDKNQFFYVVEHVRNMNTGFSLIPFNVIVTVLLMFIVDCSEYLMEIGIMV